MLLVNVHSNTAKCSWCTLDSKRLFNEMPHILTYNTSAHLMCVSFVTILFAFDTPKTWVHV